MEGSKTPRKLMSIIQQSCDFCYRRKIKCDGHKPRCSHCITYKTDCTYTAPSRKSRPKKRRSCAQIEDGTSISNTQGRLQHLEALLEQLTERVKVAEKHNEVQAQIRLQEERPIDTATLSTTTTTTATSKGGDADHDNNPPKLMFLPPLQQVLHIVEIFLQKFNAVLPLFDAKTLLRLIHDFYSLGPQQRDPVAWAAINVVLALAHQKALVGSSSPNCSVEYLSRAESVLSEVVLGDIQLLNIQVLVGMVMLLQASLDLRSSLILIATTMRLAHSIGLHDRTSSAHLDPTHARQRACVFWMAYILDKDLSMRSKQASVQLDDDIDLDLPSLEIAGYQINARGEIADDSIGAGYVTTVDGTVKMNYFVTRIQLAVIEGGVYDYLFSTRSQKRSREERSRALESVACALEKWKASIPPEFSTAMALRRVRPGMLRFLVVLHSTSLMCTTLLNQANAWNAQWVDSIRRYAREGTIPLLPPQWEALVDEARDLMVLFGALPVPDRWNFW
ncbi:hypothetical protein A1O3_02282 [Capronia epimyces CBS 606.96]|uniref:Zn(2)-C6 fungal-type domain-containing protein n=1 Tax=Capronia epimyces CBS 606.96 TaxID=1182542 RepID=W9YIY4_9EURO|nr:uncharacterized protein A1O3_02282 [Capronia epimyces CBS 606.96]EXJ89216.1 hypothetical protein A1O3_02282 [Capronia epimyces CBS 606.96]